MPRVLVIDDQSHVRAAISAVLYANKIDAVAVESGRLGLSELSNSPFDLVIVDIYMPDMDGVKLIKSVRERTPDLPIIAISGAMFRESGRTVLDILPKSPHLAGVTYLQKPFRPNELMQAIHGAIGVAA